MHFGPPSLLSIVIRLVIGGLMLFAGIALIAHPSSGAVCGVLPVMFIGLVLFLNGLADLLKRSGR